MERFSQSFFFFLSFVDFLTGWCTSVMSFVGYEYGLEKTTEEDRGDEDDDS